MLPKDIIYCVSLVQEAMCEYRNIVTSKQWEPTYIKEKSQYEPLPLIFSTE